jgi:hypothetical protein
MTQTFRYQRGALYADYARAAAGFALTAGPLLFVDPNAVIVVILGGFALLFALFGARSAARHVMTVEITEQGLATTGPRAVGFGWSELDQFQLKYYSTRRDRTSGWMELQLGAGKRRLKLDSTLEGFPDLVKRGAEAARANALDLDPWTIENLNGLGLVPPGLVARPAGAS